MNITILAVGKLKEEYLKKAAAHWTKEIQRHCGFSVLEIPDENNDNRPPETVMKIEGDGILKRIRPDQYVITLEIDGKRRDAKGFSRLLHPDSTDGPRDLVFVIGGSLGLSPEVRKRADRTLSFSPMTFPHQLMRIMLMETLANSL